MGLGVNRQVIDRGSVVCFRFNGVHLLETIIERGIEIVDLSGQGTEPCSRNRRCENPPTLSA